MSTPLDPNDTPGRRLLGGAWAFLKSAELLHDSDPDQLAWATCFAHVAFTIELGLKGFLRERGMSEQDQRRLGHDLSAAFEAALSHGFKPTHPLQRTLSQELSSHHSDMSLRYLHGISVNLPALPEAIGVAKLLLRGLHLQSKRTT